MRIAMLMLALCLVGCQEAPPAAPPRSEATIPAEQLQQAYEMNEVKADSILKGHWLTVKGEVERVARDVLNQPYVTLKTSVGLGVQCTFPENQAAAIGELLPGKKVAILGKCGGRTVGIVSLDDCRLTP
jgi:tRNA_anti-like